MRWPIYWGVRKIGTVEDWSLTIWWYLILEPTWANTCLRFRAQSFWWFWFWTSWICGTRIQPDVGQQVLWGLTFFRDPAEKPLGFHQQIGAGIIRYNRQKGELQTISWHLLWDDCHKRLSMATSMVCAPILLVERPQTQGARSFFACWCKCPWHGRTFASKLVTKNIPRPGLILRGTSPIIGVWSPDGKDSPSDFSCVANVSSC